MHMNDSMIKSDFQYQSKVLIVDDDRQHNDMLCECVEENAYTIIKAHDGLEAFEKAKAEKPDLILMDIMMPVLNGFDSCKKIKEDPETRHIPVIFITALNDLDSILKGFACGGVDYVSKPFHTKEIISRVQIHLKMQYQHRQLMDMAIELKASKEEAEAARLVAEKANQAKTNFLSIMSHELMTPMNMIISMTHFALNSDLNTKQASYLQNIQKSSEMLKELMDDILDYSSIERGDAVTYQKPFKLSEVISLVRNKLSMKLSDNKKIKLTVFEDPLIPNYLIGDAIRLQKVLYHLGDNAVKFTKQGYVCLKTRLLEINEDKVTISLSIEDTGIGMNVAQQESLFQLFTQADNSKTRKYRGVGLGLALCRQLIAMMNGKIFVNSTPEKGSIIKLQFDFLASDKVEYDKFQLSTISENISEVQNDPKETPDVTGSKEQQESLKEQQESLESVVISNENFSESFINLLNELDSLLKKRNPKKCKKIFEAIEQFNLTEKTGERIKQIQKNIQRYQFKKAQEELSFLLKHDSIDNTPG